MKSTWTANLIAAFVIGITILVGALGAQGAPEHRPSARPSGVIAPSDLQRPAHRSAIITSVTSSDETLPAPSCDSRTTVRGAALSFLCPGGWFLWENDEFTDGVPQSLAIASNHRPLAEGSEGLPDGWFKVDMYVTRSDATLTRLEAEMCADRTAYGRISSCGQTTIAGRQWVLLRSREMQFPGETRVAATIADGIRYVVVGFVPDGPSAWQGRNEIADVLGSLRIASA
ncbi:MAG: hypothetical protein ACXVQ7_12765 [Actinomycetota bacterium]